MPTDPDQQYCNKCLSKALKEWPSVRQLIKYNDKHFEIIGGKIGALVDNKNSAYGDAVGVTEEIVKLLYPNGIKPDQYGDLLSILRILDKICRIALGDKSAFDESPWNDIAGYGIRKAGHIQEG